MSPKTCVGSRRSRQNSRGRGIHHGWRCGARFSFRALSLMSSTLGRLRRGGGGVGGEVFFGSAFFDELNAGQVAAGEREFANARNAASGSLRQKAEHKNATQLALMEDRLSRLRVLVHGVGAWPDPPVSTQSEVYELLAGWGLPVSSHARVVGSVDAVRDFIEFHGEHRHAVEHEIDGIVVKI